MPKRMDTVEPDWSWTEDPLVLAAVERVCKEYSKRGSAKLSFHEAFAEASTYISFRPDKFLDITYDAEGVERRNWNTARIVDRLGYVLHGDRKSTRLNSSHVKSSYAVSCLKKNKQ